MSALAYQERALVPDLEAELDRLKVASIGSLRKEWARFFQDEPPEAFGPDLLRRSIAQKLQEQAYGVLPKDIRRLLKKLVRDHAKQKGGPPATPSRRIRSGAILHREWKGVSHCVTVHQDQFLYEGKAYPTLSQIARLITGTRWNGPRFFGLRASAAKHKAEEAAASSTVRASDPSAAPESSKITGFISFAGGADIRSKRRHPIPSSKAKPGPLAGTRVTS